MAVIYDPDTGGYRVDGSDPDDQYLGHLPQQVPIVPTDIPQGPYTNDAAPPQPVYPPEGGIHDPALNEAWKAKSLEERYAPMPNEAERGFSYWAQQGIDPATAMFDQNGQLLPGWARTDRGYEVIESPSSPYSYDGGTSGGTSSGGFTWASLPSDFGAPPAPFAEVYQNPTRPAHLQGEYVAPTRPANLQGPYVAPERPANLQGAYVAPVWGGGDYKSPSMEDVTGEPGFQTGLNSGLLARDRSAAARGSILSGGHQKALTRFGTDYGATKFAESNARLFDQYKERYGQFLDQSNASLTARGVNEAAYQTDTANALTARGVNEAAFQTDTANALTARNVNETTFQADSSQALAGYNTRYTAYLNDILNTRNAENDWWMRNQDQVRNGLTASSFARPNPP